PYAAKAGVAIGSALLIVIYLSLGGRGGHGAAEITATSRKKMQGSIADYPDRSVKRALLDLKQA
ncbi:MAG TPA: hypothetical protein VLD58_14745, partial [Gemmatimonadales bacterium]|nr:hypothetical protein [Gemmatimonadales bacterium]